MLHLHHEICQTLAQDLNNAVNNPNTANSFTFRLCYENYCSSCEKYGLDPVPLEKLLTKGIHGSKKVIYIPFV